MTNAGATDAAEPAVTAPGACAAVASGAAPAAAPRAGGGRQKDGRTFQVVSFRLGAEEYGVDIMTVQEIILVGCITQVPEVPEHVLGVINLRGNVIPILNLRARFGMPEQAADEATRIVVMNLQGRTVGVVVDGVSEVLRLSREDIAPTPASLVGAGKDYVTGLARRKDRLLILLDMSRLLVGREPAPARRGNGDENTNGGA
jgi:purine-binding chemotaxis protein CheW